MSRERLTLGGERVAAAEERRENDDENVADHR
jgi:hypothetical protein